MYLPVVYLKPLSHLLLKKKNLNVSSEKCFILMIKNSKTSWKMYMQVFFQTKKIKNVRSPTSLGLLSDPGEIKVPSANQYHWCVFPIAIKMTLILRRPFSMWRWKCQLLSHVQLSETPRTVVHLAPLSMEFSRQEYWVAIPFFRGSSQPRGWTWSPALQVDYLPSKPPGKPCTYLYHSKIIINL